MTFRTVSTGGLRFFERLEIKNALAYMRLASRRHADVAFERVVNTPPRGIGGKTVDAIRSLARASGTSMWQACKDGIARGAFKGRAATTVGAFIKLIDDIAGAVENAPLYEIAEQCIEASGLMAFHSKEGGERGMARKENLEELVTACRQFGRDLVFPVEDTGEEESAGIRTRRVSRPGGARERRLSERGPGAADDDHALRQGARVPVGLHGGYGGGPLSQHSVDARARAPGGGTPTGLRRYYPRHAPTLLHLCRDEAHERHAEPQLAVALPRRSAGGNACRKCAWGVRCRGRFRAQAGNGAKDLGEDHGGLRIGQTVRHAKFGDGIVLQAEGGGERTRVQVNFANAGSKWLMLAYANLEVLG